MKKVWSIPTAKVEKFVSNEYVAACWAVACDIPNTETNGGIGPDKVAGKVNGDVSHGITECGQTSHQYIRVENGNAVEMIETNTQGMGNLQCTIYQDDHYEQVRDISTVKENDYIYWTSSHDSRTWHHHGQVQGTSNHS